MFADDLRIFGKSRDTIRGYPGIVRAFSRFNGGDLLNVTRESLKAYLSTMRERKLKETSIEHHFIILSEFYEFLIYNEIYTSANPITTFKKRFLGHKRPPSSDSRKCPSTEEVVKLVDVVLNTRNRAIIVLLFKTGIHRKELSELDLSGLDMDKRTITLKPTEKLTNRIVYFDEEAAYALGRWLKRRDILNKSGNSALFLSQYNERLSPYAIDELFQKYTKAAGLYKGGGIADKLTPHCARHWFTTELLEAGMSFEHVQHLRGDKGREAANRYHHIKEKELKEEYDRCIPQLGLI